MVPLSFIRQSLCILRPFRKSTCNIASTVHGDLSPAKVSAYRGPLEDSPAFELFRYLLQIILYQSLMETSSAAHSSTFPIVKWDESMYLSGIRESCLKKSFVFSQWDQDAADSSLSGIRFCQKGKHLMAPRLCKHFIVLVNLAMWQETEAPFCQDCSTSGSRPMERPSNLLF